jgi:hypothetical protein
MTNKSWNRLITDEAELRIKRKPSYVERQESAAEARRLKREAAMSREQPYVRKTLSQDRYV